ncbi:hypothetical protein ACEWY4_019520 [Coilia grayii]|uniref:Uncharacterized protein n=1 Tax=Coilia grayii TaxID=363190 RepID=A0ABD1JA37_9TELE
MSVDRRMSPIVILLLFTLIPYRVYGCPTSKYRVTSGQLLRETKEKQTLEFRRVFPTNYNVTHRYSASLLCNDRPCCVFSAAVVLRDSWLQLLKHLREENYIYVFIRSMIDLLKNITEEHQQRFLEKPDLSIFPSVSSSPEALLSFTVDVLSRWEELKCPAGVRDCEFYTAAPEEEEDGDYEVPYFGKEGNSQSLQELEMTAAPTNTGAALFHFPGHVVWGVFLLWTALEF